MEKYAKHLLGVIGGSGLAIAGAIIWAIIGLGADWSRVREYGLANMLNGIAAWPFAILGTIFIAAGVFLIVIPILNLVTRE